MGLKPATRKPSRKNDNDDLFISWFDDVIVATCDREIANVVCRNKGKVIMTSRKHKRAVDRTEEARRKIEKKYKKKFNLIVMIQGD